MQASRCKWPICGMGCAACCSVLSAWGVVMLAILGYLYSTNNRYVDAHNELSKDEMEKTGTACYIAAGLYVATLLFSIWQLMLNLSKKQR